MDAATLSTCTGATASRAAQYADYLTAAMDLYAIDSPARQAAFLAQIGHESGGLHWVTELWGPTPDQSRYEPPSAKATELGNTQPGDGFLFRGRGFIQITGRANYDAVGDGLCLDCTTNPDLLASDQYAPVSAAWWWSSHGLNALADEGDFLTITRVINGGTNGLPDRMALWAKAKQALGVLT